LPHEGAKQMWDMLYEFSHDDPQHHALAFCLIWWIPLLLIPLAWWVIARSWRKLTPERQWAVAVMLACPVCLSVMQLRTNWYLAGYWAPLMVYPLAVAGYSCLVFLIWLSYSK